MAGKSVGSSSSLRGPNGSRECAPDDRLRDGANPHLSSREMDCFACARNDGKKISPFVIPGWPEGADLSPSGKSYGPAGWVEPFAKPINATSRIDGYRFRIRSLKLRRTRSLHASCALVHAVSVAQAQASSDRRSAKRARCSTNYPDDATHPFCRWLRRG